ncbi:hypothetical protein BJ912DRAFT_1031166 [Pholiota molesta]|nr:hypothetical protein BJ912DRAFT_1031166 [Pholiota molesta]
MPSSVPSSTASEYGFVGFSYESLPLGDVEERVFDVRKTFKGRYFGWDNPDIWKTRRDTLLAALHSNPKAKYVTRALQFGSEPLYDDALTPTELTTQINAAKKNYRMPYGFQERASDGSQNVMDAIDIIDGHMLPFFDTKASTASKSWPIVQEYLNYFIDNGNNKKIYLSQNGWPSTTYSGVEPNSPSAVADNYYKLLDDNCAYFKDVAGGGPGYGIYGTNGALKFPFSPKTSC